MTYLSRARSLSHIQSRSLPLSRHPFSLFLARALSLSLSLCGHTYVEKARKPLARGLFGKLFAGKRDQKKVKSSHDGSLDAGRGGGDAQQLAALKDGERRYCRFDAAVRAGDDVLESGEVTLNALAPLSHPCVRKPYVKPCLCVLRRSEGPQIPARARLQIGRRQKNFNTVQEGHGFV